MFKKSIVRIDELLEHSIFEEKYVYKNGLFQLVKPEEKILFSIFLFSVSLLENKFVSIIFLFFFSIVSAYLSKVNLLDFFKRTFIFIPIYSLLISLPRLFLNNNSRDIILNLMFTTIYLSSRNLNDFLVFNLRVTFATSLMVLISMTTSISEISYALRKIKVPREVSLILLITYRFLFIYITKIKELFLAIESKARKNIGLRETGKLISTLLLRSFEESEAVFLAIESRELQDIRILDRSKVKHRIAFFALVILFLLVSLLSEFLL